MLITIEGPMGAGKTATTTFLAYANYLSGRKIYSNYHLNFKHTVFDQTLFFEMNEKNFELHNCLILADEGYLYANARNSMSKGNRAVHYYAMQTRKRNVDMIFATQSFRKLDFLIREAVMMRIGCKFIRAIYEDLEGNPVNADGKGRPLYFKPGQKIKMVKDLKTGKIRPLYLRTPKIRLAIRRLDIATFTIRTIEALPIFPLYNTDEIVKVPSTQLKAG